MRALVAGWFTFEGMGATAGDLMARDLVCSWLDHARQSYDVALAPPFSGGIDWRVADPKEYSHVVFVCGPFGNGEPVAELLARFAGCRLVGLDLSMLEPLDSWNPFDLLLERDSSSGSLPDLSFLSRQPLVPVVGMVLIHPQPEYDERDQHELANNALGRLAASREMAVIEIDTRLDSNRTGLRTASEVESLIARMDLILTTRLHGLVLALKNGVPAIAIDPVAGGHKIIRQAKTVGWPLVFTVDQLSDAALQRALEHCLTPGARRQAELCCTNARHTLEHVRGRFLAEMMSGSQG